MSVGLGWFIGSAADALMVSHSGSDLGFKNNLWLLPDLKSGVVVMANSSTAYPVVEAVSLAVLGVLLDVEFPLEPARRPVRMPLGEIVARDRVAAATRAYRDWFAASRDLYHFDEIELIRLADSLVEAKRSEDSIAILELNLESYEVPSLTLERLFEINLKLGRIQEADHHYERLRELAMSHPSAAESLQRLDQER